MATATVSEVTQATITDMIEASRDMANALGTIRGKFLAIDGDLARRTESIRVKFEAFGDAAAAGNVVDPVTLATLSRVYEDAAGVVGELARSRNHKAARSALSAAVGLTLLCMSLVESGTQPVFSA